MYSCDDEEYHSDYYFAEETKVKTQINSTILRCTGSAHSGTRVHVNKIS